MKRILVTGANGFVGRKLCKVLQNTNNYVRAAVRHIAETDSSDGQIFSPSMDVVAVGEIGLRTDWSSALAGIDTVVHLAARVHILQEKSQNPIESFRAVNVQGTERLAQMAAECGISRFVYVSSISVHGNSTGEKAYVEEDGANPHGFYAVSKLEGELALRKIAERSGFDLVIVRPPLVYGPGVGGNFLRLMCWADKGWPLPLGSVRNLRSFIGIENLVDLLVSCVEHERAAGQTFLAADGEDLSTPDLIRRVAVLLGRPARLIPFPVAALRLAASAFRSDDVMERLCNSLQVNAEKARMVLGWRPRVSLDEGLKQTTKWYLDTRKDKKIKTNGQT